MNSGQKEGMLATAAFNTALQTTTGRCPDAQR